jgi:predicted P-loop ATPase
MIQSLPATRVRAAYAHMDEERRRTAVFCGTTNHDDVLNDPTGNRRLLPFKYISIDYKVTNAIDRVDLFMEAYHLYKSGYNWQILGSDIQRLEKLTGDHENVSTEFQVLNRYLTDEKPNEHLDFSQCLQYLNTQVIGIKLDDNKLRSAFKKKKWPTELKKIAGRVSRYFHLRKTEAYDKPGENLEPMPF